jgi:hypothetical protein
MSREPYSYDPQDTRDASPRRSARQHRSETSDARGGRNPSPEVPARDESTEILERHPSRDAHGDSPRAHHVRDRAYLLRDSEIHSLKEVGTFRVIPAADLAIHAYGGNRQRMERDVRRLVRHGLLTDETMEISQKKTLRVITLTKAGHRFLKKTNQLPDDQPLYHEWVKPREVKHDADLYRLYQKEAARIERGGDRPIRVLLDFQLKHNLNRDLALLGPEKDDPDRKRQVAEKHGLQLVNGKIPVPDLRVEYETPEGALRHVDLELATRDYRPRALAEKARAGFSLYSRAEDAARLRRVLDERGLTAGILNL